MISIKTINLKKAAMFGLDARIALAIFGALSVISGAALYSAIQQSKVVSFVAQVNEVAKAYEQFYLDTGVHASVSGSFSLNIKQLIENTPSIDGWKGPYLSFNNINPSLGIDFPNYGEIILFRAKNGTFWGGPVELDPAGKCVAGDQCSLWLEVTGLDKSFAKKVDEYIDGSVDADGGDFRWFDSSDRVHWKFFPGYQ